MSSGASFTAGYGRLRKLGVGFRTAGYGRHRSQWVNCCFVEKHQRSSVICCHLTAMKAAGLLFGRLERLYGSPEWTNWKKLDKNSKHVNFFTNVFRTKWLLHVLPSTSNIGVALIDTPPLFRIQFNNGEIKRANALQFLQVCGQG